MTMQSPSLSSVVRNMSIALVGNSRRILTEKPGRRIDSADFVIRMNRGLPGLIDPNAIGMRTDLWATAKYWADATAVNVAKHILWMKLTPLGREQIQMLKRDENVLNRTLWSWAEDDEAECREFVGADPGTGIRLLWWLRTKANPRSVSCYGMDCWEVESHWSGKMNTANHNPAMERAAMLRLL